MPALEGERFARAQDATGDMAKPPDNATPNEKAGQEQAASQARAQSHCQSC